MLNSSCNASDVSDKTLMLHRSIPTVFSWLTQANYVFSRLEITANLEDYRTASTLRCQLFSLTCQCPVLMHSIEFEIFASSIMEEPPAGGFLFLCPLENFQVTPSSFRWPDCPAYWSLDPSGVERLSTEEAARLGFPELEFNMRIIGLSWDSSVYAGLRQYLQARAFDPDTPAFDRRNNGQLVRFSNRIQPAGANGPSITLEQIIVFR